jgi:L-ascorbate metabolism protein UlaG (beta-lactamase superfamily)
MRGIPVLGAKTIGNATLIAYDDGPVLATDPWFGDEDDAFFGSWGLPNEIPATEKTDILRAKYIWFSHGHPDHLNPQSIERLRHSSILLPDHVGARIKKDLEAEGYGVKTLPDGRWVQLSKRIKVFCIADYIQDAVLLVDVGGRLFINMNDSDALARLRLIAKIAGEYRHSYLLRRSGYGDAGMMNFFDTAGNRIEPEPKTMLGRWLAQYAQRVGAKSVIPFSSFHQFQREDSAWANAFRPTVSAYREGFDESIAEFITPFVWIDCASGEILELDPVELPCTSRKPEECGDSWSDELGADDKRVLAEYFHRKKALHEMVGFLTFSVGGKSHTIDLGGRRDRGITFEVPRNSLMSAVTHRVFDDLILGGFMKTTPHHKAFQPGMDFYQNFGFVVGKYADNGGAETLNELRSYFAEYRKRSGAEWLLYHFIRGGHTLFRHYVRKDSGFYTLAQNVYTRVLRN